MADTTYDSFGTEVPVGDASAASADPTGLAQTYLETLQSGNTSGINFNDIKNLLTSFKLKLEKSPVLAQSGVSKPVVDSSLVVYSVCSTQS